MAKGDDAGDWACSPTWTAPAPNARFVYVPCNKGDEILEVDLEQWAITRRFQAPRGPYNAAVTHDGARLVVTQKTSGEVSVWDLGRGTRLALQKNENILDSDL